MSDTVDTIKQQIAENPVLLYMKGDPRGPKCGFSAQTVQAVMACERPFAYVDVLSTLRFVRPYPVTRNGRHFPQLWVNGELVGGCDIVVEMYQNGELKQLIQDTVPAE